MKWYPMESAPKDGTRVLLKGQLRVKFRENLSVERIFGVVIGQYSGTCKWHVEAVGLNHMHPPEQKHFEAWARLPE